MWIEGACPFGGREVWLAFVVGVNMGVLVLWGLWMTVRPREDR